MNRNTGLDASGSPIRHWAFSHPGTLRPTNQDAYLCRPDIGVFAVADGVGGHDGGEFASMELMRVLDTLPSNLPASKLLAGVRSRLQDAHERLLAVTQVRGTQATATTVVVLLLHRTHLACLWAGDSRFYVLRDGQLHQLTADHSIVGEMLRSGALTEAQAARHPNCNVITRAIGVSGNAPLVDKVTGQAEPRDCFLLCSDGLPKAVQHEELSQLLGDVDPAAAILKVALARGAIDNITAVVVAL